MSSAQSGSLGLPRADPLEDFGPLSPAIRVLLSRSSVAPKTLVAPGPNHDELRLLIASALRAPAHEGLRPWRFISIEGDGRQQLSRSFAEIRRRQNPGIRPAELAMTWKKTMRAPTLIAVVMRLVEDHPKVPPHEQYIAIGAAVHGLMLAAHALGFGAIMLSGNRTRDSLIHTLLGLAAEEQMVVFISVGTLAKPIPPKLRSSPAAYLQIWQGNDDLGT